MTLRIGQGWDAHPLVEGRPTILAGVLIEPAYGPEGHSDGDVVLHALADALLGASAAGDLGTLFGTDRPEHRGASSRRFVDVVRERTGRPAVSNVDVTIVGARPRVGPHREAMRVEIAGLLEIPVDRVSVKASSGNGLGELGRGEGIAATVVVLVETSC